MSHPEPGAGQRASVRMAEAEKSTDPIAIPLRSGLAQGGLGGSGNELLDDG